MTRLLLLGTIGLVGCLISTTQAQPPEGKVVVEIRVKTMIGKVMTLDAKAGKLTIRINDLAENIVTAPDCKYGSDEDGLANLSELRIGEQVIVTATDENGRLIAHRVTRLKPKKARGKKH